MKKLGAILLLAAAAWWGYHSWRSRTPALPGARTTATAKAETVPCMVWFPSRAGMELCEETSMRPRTEEPTARLRGILDALHRGPVTPCSLPLFPEDTAPRAIFLAADGTAYLDYPASVFERPLGLREEFLFVRALSRSILRNCPDVRAFVLLVDGNPREMVSSHIPAHGKFVLPSSAPKR